MGFVVKFHATHDDAFRENKKGKASKTKTLDSKMKSYVTESTFNKIKHTKWETSLNIITTTKTAEILFAIFTWSLSLKANLVKWFNSLLLGRVLDIWDKLATLNKLHYLLFPLFYAMADYLKKIHSSFFGLHYLVTAKW